MSQGTTNVLNRDIFFTNIDKCYYSLG